LDVLGGNAFGVEFLDAVSQDDLQVGVEFLQEDEALLADRALVVFIEEVAALFGAGQDADIILQNVFLLTDKTSGGILLEAASGEGVGHAESF